MTSLYDNYDHIRLNDETLTANCRPSISVEKALELWKEFNSNNECFDNYYSKLITSDGRRSSKSEGSDNVIVNCDEVFTGTMQSDSSNESLVRFFGYINLSNLQLFVEMVTETYQVLWNDQQAFDFVMGLFHHPTAEQIFNNHLLDILLELWKPTIHQFLDFLELFYLSTEFNPHWPERRNNWNGGCLDIFMHFQNLDQAATVQSYYCDLIVGIMLGSFHVDPILQQYDKIFYNIIHCDSYEFVHGGFAYERKDQVCRWIQGAQKVLQYSPEYLGRFTGKVYHRSGLYSHMIYKFGLEFGNFIELGNQFDCMFEACKIEGEIRQHEFVRGFIDRLKLNKRDAGILCHYGLNWINVPDGVNLRGETENEKFKNDGLACSSNLLELLGEPEWEEPECSSDEEEKCEDSDGTDRDMYDLWNFDSDEQERDNGEFAESDQSFTLAVDTSTDIPALRFIKFKREEDIPRFSKSNIPRRCVSFAPEFAPDTNSIVDVLKVCHSKLKKLYIYDAHRLEDDFAKALCKLCPNLTEMYITLAVKITDKGAILVGKGCPKLKSLGICDWDRVRGCGALTNKFLMKFIDDDEFLSELTELTVYDQTRLEWKYLCKLGMKRKYLKIYFGRTAGKSQDEWANSSFSDEMFEIN